MHKFPEVHLCLLWFQKRWESAVARVKFVALSFLWLYEPYAPRELLFATSIFNQNDRINAGSDRSSHSQCHRFSLNVFSPLTLGKNSSPANQHSPLLSQAQPSRCLIRCLIHMQSHAERQYRGSLNWLSSETKELVDLRYVRQSAQNLEHTKKAKEHCLFVGLPFHLGVPNGISHILTYPIWYGQLSLIDTDFAIKTRLQLAASSCIDHDWFLPDKKENCSLRLPPSASQCQKHRGFVMVCWQKHVHLDSLYIIPSTYSNVKFRPVHLGCPQFCWREFANTERIIEMTSDITKGEPYKTIKFNTE